jgi:acetyl esterase/lipase
VNRVLPCGLVLLLAACAGGAGSSTRGPVPQAQVLLPSGDGPSAVVVLVPGGGWRRADPGGLVPLAERLAGAGHAAATTTYRAADAGERFPTPVEDVLCAAASAAEQAVDAGVHGPVVLVGHSAGGHLAALAALRPDDFRADCPYRDVVPDAVVGIAGAYDVGGLPGVALDLFGVPEDEDPDRWHQGDVLAWADQRPALPALLVHGDADDVVPVTMSRDLAARLDWAGHPVEIEVLTDVDHLSVLQPDVVAPLLLDWLADLLERPAR